MATYSEINKRVTTTWLGIGAFAIIGMLIALSGTKFSYQNWERCVDNTQCYAKFTLNVSSKIILNITDQDVPQFEKKGSTLYLKTSVHGFVTTSPSIETTLMVPTTKALSTTRSPDGKYLRPAKTGDSLLKGKNTALYVYGIKSKKQSIKWSAKLFDIDPLWIGNLTPKTELKGNEYLFNFSDTGTNDYISVKMNTLIVNNKAQTIDTSMSKTSVGYTPKYTFVIPDKATENAISGKVINVPIELRFSFDISDQYQNYYIKTPDGQWKYKTQYYAYISGSMSDILGGTILDRTLVNNTTLKMTVQFNFTGNNENGDYPLPLHPGDTITFEDPILENQNVTAFNGMVFYRNNTASVAVKLKYRNWTASGFGAEAFWSDHDGGGLVQFMRGDSSPIGDTVILVTNDNQADVDASIGNMTTGINKTTTSLTGNDGGNVQEMADVEFFNNTNVAMIVYHGSATVDSLINLRYYNGSINTTSQQLNVTPSPYGPIVHENIKIVHNPYKDNLTALTYICAATAQVNVSAGFAILNRTGTTTMKMLYSYCTDATVNISPGGYFPSGAWASESVFELLYPNQRASGTTGNISLTSYNVSNNQTICNKCNLSGVQNAKWEDFETVSVPNSESIFYVAQGLSTACILSVGKVYPNGTNVNDQIIKNTTGNCERDAQERNINIALYVEESGNREIRVFYVAQDALNISSFGWFPNNESFTVAATNLDDFETPAIASDDIEYMKFTPLKKGFGDGGMFAFIDNLQDNYAGTYWNGSNFVTSQNTLLDANAVDDGGGSFLFLFNTNLTGGGFPPAAGQQLPQIAFVNPTPANTSNATGYFIVNVTSNASTSTSMVFTDYNKSLVGWWRFNTGPGENNSQMEDFSTYKHNLTCVTTDGCPKNKTGMFGNARTLNSSNYYLVGDSADDINVSSGFTLSLWVNNNYTDASQTLLSNLNVGDSTAQFYLVLQGGSSNGQLRLITEDSVPNYWQYDTNSLTLLDNKTHHIVATLGNPLSASSVRFYVDGVNITDITASDGGLTMIQPSGYGRTCIGCDKENNPNSEGHYDDVMIFSRVLTIDEVRSLYNATQYQYQHNFSGTAGNVNYTSYIQDESGNINQTEQRGVNYTAIPDSDPPTSTILLNNTELNVFHWVKVNGTASDDVALSSITLNISNGSTVLESRTRSLSGATAKWEFNISVQDCSNFTYTIQVSDTLSRLALNNTGLNLTQYCQVRTPYNIINSNDGGSVAWSDPQNASAADGTESTVALTAVSSTSQLLNATNFSFSIPLDKNISGLKVQITRDSTVLSDATDKLIRFMDAYALVGDNVNTSMIWSTTSRNDSYGNRTGVYSYNWNSTVSNGAGFGIVVSGKVGAIDILGVDSIRVAAFYNATMANTCTVPKENLILTSNTTLCPGNYYLNGSNGTGIINITANLVTLTCSNTQLIGNQSNGSWAIYVPRFNHITVQGCNVSGYERGFSHENQASSNTFYFFNNTFSNNSDAGIFLLRGGAVIDGNQFIDNGFSPLLGAGGDGVRGNGASADNNTVTNNLFIGGYDALHLNGGADFWTVINNTIRDKNINYQKHAMFLSNSAGHQIIGNNFSQGRWSIESDSSGARNLYIAGNLFYNITENGTGEPYSPAHFQNSKNITFFNNTVSLYANEFCNNCNDSFFLNNTYPEGIGSYKLTTAGRNVTVTETTSIYTLVNLTGPFLVLMNFSGLKNLTVKNDTGVEISTLSAPYDDIVNYTCALAGGASCTIATNQVSYNAILSSSLSILVTSVTGDTCSCPTVNNNFNINDGSICTLTTTCNIGTGILRINNGQLRILTGGKMIASGCFVNDPLGGIFTLDGAGLFCG